MSDLIQTSGTGEENLPEMTNQQANVAIREIAHADATQDIRLYLFHVQKGYKSLGHATFEECCENVLGKSKQSVYQAVDRVKATLRLHGVSASDLISKKSNGLTFDKEILPTRTAAELNKLASGEQVQSAWNEYKTICNNNVSVESQTFRHLKLIVARYLGRTGAEPAAPPPDHANAPQGFGTVPKVSEPPTTRPDAETAYTAPLPNRAPDPRFVVTPPPPGEAATTTEEDAEPIFDEGDRPDYVATEAVFEYNPKRRGWWIDFPGKDGTTECLFLPENIASEAPSR